MKKVLSLLLACLFVVLSFAGCTADPKLPEDTEPSAENTLESTEKPETTAAEPFPTEDEYYGEGFELEGKKYVYQEDEVLILHVKNLTDMDYDVQVIVDFYDENNVETDHQEKYFEGFGANWENYFVFRTEKPFIRFRCEIAKMESAETAYSAYLSQGTGEDAVRFCVSKSKRWTSPEGNHEVFDDWYPIVYADYSLLNTNDQQLYFSANFVLFDNNGEIFVIDAGVENHNVGPEREFPVSYVRRTACHGEEPWLYEGTPAILFEDNWNEEFIEKYNKEFNELLPEELRGDVTFIVSFVSVNDKPVW